MTGRNRELPPPPPVDDEEDGDDGLIPIDVDNFGFENGALGAKENKKEEIQQLKKWVNYLNTRAGEKLKTIVEQLAMGKQFLNLDLTDIEHDAASSIQIVDDAEAAKMIEGDWAKYISEYRKRIDMEKWKKRIEEKKQRLERKNLELDSPIAPAEMDRAMAALDSYWIWIKVHNQAIDRLEQMIKSRNSMPKRLPTGPIKP